MLCSNFPSLHAHNIKDNNKLAFDTADSLGIPRVLEPADMVLLQVPDKLSVMTYLNQLHAYFTGTRLQPQVADTPSPPSPVYVVGEHNTDAAAAGVFHKEVDAAARSPRDDQIPPAVGAALAAQIFKSPSPPPTSQSLVVEQQSSPAKSAPKQPRSLMTRQQLMNPFDDDDDVEAISPNAASTPATSHDTVASPVKSSQHSHGDESAARPQQIDLTAASAPMSGAGALGSPAMVPPPAAPHATVTSPTALQPTSYHYEPETVWQHRPPNAATSR